MKKSRVLLILAVVLTVFVLVNCTAPVPVVNPPANPTGLAATDDDGFETLAWTAVAGVTFEVKVEWLGASGSRAETSLGEKVSPFNFNPVTYGLQYGTYDWCVRARQNTLYSGWVKGTQFEVLEPVVPPDPETVLTLELWDPNMPVSSSSRDATPVLYLLGENDSSSRDSGPYFLNLNYLFGLVTAEEAAAERDELPVMTIQLFLQKQGEAEQHQYPAAGVTYELNANNQYPFVFPEEGNDSGERKIMVDLEEGFYYLWAQGLGDDAKSDKKPFEVRNLNTSGVTEITAEFLSVAPCCVPDEILIDSGSTVCSLGTASVTYTVSVDFSAIPYFITDYDWVAAFSLGAVNESWSLLSRTLRPASMTDDEWEIEILFATECSKFATVAFGATFTSVFWDEDAEAEATEQHWVSDLLIIDHDFVLDMATPTATLTIIDATSPSTKTATVTFYATDTKCLDDILFSFFFDKGDNKTTDESWGIKDVSWGDLDFEIGVDDHRVTVNATYVKATDKLTAAATFVLDMSKYGMDGATLTVEANVNDCCDYGTGHLTTESTDLYIDNVFLSKNFEYEDYRSDVIGEDHDIIDGNGFFYDADNDRWYLNNTTSASTPATVTVRFVDANYSTLTFDNSDLVTKSGISITAVSTSIETSTPLVYSCTGYATKLVDIFTLTVAATSASNVTDTVRATVTGIDDNGNEYEVPLTFYVDTVMPTLTYLTGHQALSADPTDHYVDFGFSRDVNYDYAGFAATLTVLNSASQTVMVKNYTQAEIEQYTTIDTLFKVKTGFTLPTGGAVRLEAIAQDLVGNVWESQLQGPISWTSSNR